MKFICTQQDLNASLDIARIAIPAKTTMSILQYFFFDVQANTIKLIANDMENGIETILRGEVKEEGYVAIEAALISSIVKTLPPYDVYISSDANFLVSIDCGDTHFSLPGRSGDDFTFPPVIEQAESFTMQQPLLKSLIAQTYFSISTNDATQIMTGELMELEETAIRLVALDGHRIALRRVVTEGKNVPHKAVIPGKTLNKLRNILSDNSDRLVQLSFTDKHVCFSFDATTMVSRLIDGEYFDVNQMMNSDYETKITVERKQFLQEIERAMTLAQESDKKPIILKIESEVMELKISSTRGSMNGSVPVEKEGKDVMIGFNPRFLTDAIRVIDDDYLNIYFFNPKAPCFIRNDDSSYVYMILPINFKTVD